jgi:holo-[acyl-carrier protein] synthase
MGDGAVRGLGTDLVDVERFRLALARRGALADRLFAADEREYAARQHDPVPSLAARFGAKEAVMKALGVGLFTFAWRDVEVVRDDDGAPSLRLHGKAAALADERGITGWHLSLSHTREVAMAVAVAVG